MTDMSNKTKACLLSAVAAVSLGACAVIDGQAPLANNIVADAIEINEAYNQTTNAVILKNVLRARDRWPTNYTTLSGITSSPSLRRTAGLNLGPLGLGNAVGPFTGSDATLGSAHGASKQYNVNPFADKANSESILSKLKPEVAKQYFDSFPKDVVLMMFVGGAEYEGPQGKITFRNDGDDGYAFIQNIATAFGVDANAVNLKTDFEIRDPLPGGDPSCQSDRLSIKEALGANTMDNFSKLQNAFGGTVSIGRGPEHGSSALTIKACEAGKTGFVLGMTPNAARRLSARTPLRELDFDLRSFDSMIYYLGETLRSPGKTRVESSCFTRDGRIAMGPIFEVRDGRTRDNISYAARVNHNGNAYFAVPNASDTAAQGYCTPDRSATAVAILNQLLLLNQSSEFLKAPENFFN